MEIYNEYDFGYDYGNSCGYGNGSGYDYGDGSGSGSGDGHGSGDGNGSSNYGYGSSSGDGDGNGSGDGYGYGYGNGCGTGDGYGTGHSDGDGDDYGSGDSDGCGSNKIFVPHASPLVAYWAIGDDNYKHLGRQLTPTVGDVHIWDVPVELCRQGLHASWTPEGARKYRNGTLCKVACSGFAEFDKKKIVCTRRVILEVLS